MDRRLLVVSWGGGVNSTAMLIGMHERDIMPDLILFADTGGEKPETYAFLQTFASWLAAHDMPAIRVVQNDGRYKTLERNCLAKAMLPSRAFGFSSCADKYKIRPQDKMVRGWPPARAVWDAGERVTKAIGIDAGEAHRAKITEDKEYRYWYPLLDWDWDREACLESIVRAGLPVPIKSACFYCPASTKKEVLWLKQTHPELFDRAVAMEQRAKPNLNEVKGLGRHWSWEDLGKYPGRYVQDPPEQVCMCFDGSDA